MLTQWHARDGDVDDLRVALSHEGGGVYVGRRWVYRAYELELGMGEEKRRAERRLPWGSHAAQKGHDYWFFPLLVR
jgi:hypothetical protein